MDFEEYQDSLKQAHPPKGISPALQSLWQQGKGDWEAAHNIAQEINNPTGSWVHAHLHRVEGDLGNASYWYSRAQQDVFKGTLKMEWEFIARELLNA